MAAISLYYPWMHFQSDDWVKRALLTWDGIGRVRPLGAPDRDSDVVRQVLAESDLIIDCYPSQHDLETVSLAFTSLLREFQGFDHARYAVRNLRPGNPDVHIFRTPTPQGPDIDPDISAWLLADKLPADELYWIYGGENAKMTPQLAETLRSAGLAAFRDDSPWIGVHPIFGSIYGAALAETLARSLKLSPVTDSPVAHRATGALDRLEALFGPSARGPVDPPLQAYLDLTLGAAIEPAHLHELPVGKVLAFRARHATELAAFHGHVASLATELQEVAAVESPGIARRHLQSIYDRVTRKQLDELRRALRSFGVETTVGALSIKVDMGAASSTVLGAAAAAEGHTAVGAAAVAIAVLPYAAAKIGGRRRALDASPVSYLLAAEKELGARLSRRHRNQRA